jgi:hypothetical protein
MDTEADTQGPKDDELNPQIDLVGEEEITERDLVNTDSEMTRGNGVEDETILPGDLGELELAPHRGERKNGNWADRTQRREIETQRT